MANINKIRLSGTTYDIQDINLSGHTANTVIHVTASDKTNWNGKLDATDFNTYSASTNTRLAEDEEVTAAALVSLNDRVSEDEEVTAAGLNELNEALSGKQDTLIAGENITISGNVISAEGGGKAIEAGRGITVTTGATADTVSFSLPISADTGANSIKENYSDNTASGSYSHAEGFKAKATGRYSHAEGYFTSASDDASHAEGFSTSATSYYSHAEGAETSASGYFSHAEGLSTVTYNDSEHASGQYNVSSSAISEFGDSGNTLFSVGNGIDENSRHNAFEIRQNGDIYLSSGGTDILLQDHLGSGDNSVVELTQAQYDALSTIDPNIIYVITDAQGGDLSQYWTSAQTQSAITEAVSGKVDTTSIVTAITSSSTNAQVPSAKCVYDQVGGLKLVKLTQSAYDALSPNYDSNTLYVING